MKVHADDLEHHNGVKTWNIDKKRALEHRHLRWNIDTLDQPPRVHRQILRWNSDTTFWNKHRCRCSSAKLSMFPREIVDVPAHKTSMFQCVRLSMFLSKKKLICDCSSATICRCSSVTICRCSSVTICRCSSVTPVVVPASL